MRNKKHLQGKEELQKFYDKAVRDGEGFVSQALLGFEIWNNAVPLMSISRIHSDSVQSCGWHTK